MLNRIKMGLLEKETQYYTTDLQELRQYFELIIDFYKFIDFLTTVADYLTARNP